MQLEIIRNTPGTCSPDGRRHSMLHSRLQPLLFVKKRQRTLRPGEKFSTASMLTTPGPFTGSCFRAYLPASSALILLTAVLPERKSSLGQRVAIAGT